jgi:hypothetical protein
MKEKNRKETNEGIRVGLVVVAAEERLERVDVDNLALVAAFASKKGRKEERKEDGSKGS